MTAATRQSVKIGVVSDTHDLFDPQIPGLFTGVDHILHAGDIGRPSILLQLEQIAPVTAVSGNTDDPGFRYSQTEVVEVGGRKFLLHHIVNPYWLPDPLKSRIDRERPHVVIFGHTHKPLCEMVGGILYFNPGYAGRPRFGLPRTVAILHCGAQSIRPEYFPLA